MHSIVVCLVSCLSDESLRWIDRMILMSIVDQIPMDSFDMPCEPQADFVEKPEIVRRIEENEDPNVLKLSMGVVNNENINIVIDTVKNSTV